MQPFDWQTNSPFQHLRKCVTNSVENMHTDVRVKREFTKKKSNRLSRKGEKTFKAGNQILVLQKVYRFLFQSKVYARTDACKALHTWNFRGVNQTLSKAKERFTQGCWVGEKTKVRTQLRALFISCCAFLGWKSWLKNSVWEVTIPAPTECTSVIYSRC